MFLATLREKGCPRTEHITTRAASVDMPEFMHYRNAVMLFRLMLESPAAFRQKHSFPSLWFISHAEPEFNVRDVDPSGKCSPGVRRIIAFSVLTRIAKPV